MNSSEKLSETRINYTIDYYSKRGLIDDAYYYSYDIFPSLTEIVDNIISTLELLLTIKLKQILHKNPVATKIVQDYPL